MVGLLDIGEINESVTIRGKEVPVIGLDADAIFNLLWRFPELRAIMASRGEITAQGLMELAPDILATIIASSIGHAGDKKQIAAARKLTVGEQFMIIDKMLEISFPQGVGPFVDRLTVLLEGGRAGVSGWAAATKLQEQSQN